MKKILYILMVLMFCINVTALRELNGTEQDELLLNSIQSSWIAYQVNNYPNDMFNDTIVWRDFAEEPPSVSMVEGFDTVREINRAGAFAVEFEPERNNYLNPSDLGIPTSFSIRYKGNNVGIIDHNCTGFTDESPVCFIYYILDLDSLQDYDDPSSLYAGRYFIEDIFLFTNQQSPLDKFNLTLNQYQFESRGALTFAEEINNQSMTETIILKQKITGVLGYFETINDVLVEVVYIILWLFKVGVVISLLFLAIMMPLKIADLFKRIRQKYFSQKG